MDYLSLENLIDTLTEEIKKLKEENYRLKYIECLSKGLLHKDLVEEIKKGGEIND